MNARLAVAAAAVLVSGCQKAGPLLGPSHLVTGIVVDEAGAPVANVTLIGHRPEDVGKGYVQTFPGRSQKDGTFRIVHNPMGGPKPTGSVAFSTHAAGFVLTEMTVPVPSENVKVVVSRGGTVKVHAVKADGSPAVGPAVIQSVTRSRWPTVGEPPPVRTDAQGNCSFSGLAAGEHVVVVSVPGTASVPVEQGDDHGSFIQEMVEVFAARAKVIVPKDYAPVSVELKVADTGLVLTGKVVDEKGAPVEGASVVGDGITSVRVAKTDAKGAFTFTQMPPGVVLMNVWKQGYDFPQRWSMVQAKAGDAPVLTLKKGSGSHSH